MRQEFLEHLDQMYSDKVLVDAPCSGISTDNGESSDIKYNKER